MSRGILVVLVVMLFGPAPAAPVSASWGFAFEEVAVEVGIVHQNAGHVKDPAGWDLAWPAFAEVLGPGACWADLTGDGYDDLYIANQRYNDLNPYAQGYNELFDPTNRFYVNNGDGTFTQRTVQTGLESRTFDFGCSAADHGGDGHVDLLVYGFGTLKLYQNNGDGSFTDITQAAGLDVDGLCLPYECWVACSAWTDYNGNGWLDLFVCTYVESDMEDGLRTPQSHVAQYNLLFRNNGDGTFTEVAFEAGVQGIAADTGGSKSLGAVWFDANRNGWPDLYVANDLTPNEMYWNNGDGTFTRDDDAGLYDDRAGMGVASGYTTRSPYPDVYITHYAAEHNGFYENRGDGTFLDRSGEEGLAEDFFYVGWGTDFVDLDRDGWLDIVAVNGHTVVTNPADQDTLVFRQEPQGDGSAKWVDMTQSSGPGVLEKKVSRGAAFADFMLDGNVDVFIGNNENQTVQLLRGHGVTNHWVYVQPVQPGPNHQAVGAIVEVEAGGFVQYKQIQAGSSFLSQNTLLAMFGLGQAQTVDRVTVHWPHGGTTTVHDQPVDHVIRVDRESGSWLTDTLSPLTKATIVGEDGSMGHWFQSGIEVQLDAVDRAVGEPSGLVWTQYRFVKDGEVGEWTPYDGELFSFPAIEGEHVLEFQSLDQVGNLEPLRRERFGVDLSPPVTDHHIEGTAASNGWWLDAELSILAEDPLSGVQQIRFRVNEGPWEVYSGPVRFEEGVHEVEYYAMDAVGNEAEVKQVTLKVDATPPVLDLVRPAPGGVYQGDEQVGALGSGPAVLVASLDAVGGSMFTVQLEAMDKTSGVARVDLFLNGQPVQTFFGAKTMYAWEWNASGYPGGTYVLQAVVQDRAGNVEQTSRFLTLLPMTSEGLSSSLANGPSLYPFVGPSPPL